MLTRLKWNPRWRRRTALIHQATTAECGVACIAMIASYWGWRISLHDVRRVAPPTARGITMRSLLDISEKVGLQGHSAKVTQLRDLRGLMLPAVIHYTAGHFVVLVKATKHNVIVHDPSQGVVKMNWESLALKASGVFAEFKPMLAAVQSDSSPKLRLKAVLGHVTGLAFTAVQVLALSLLLQVIVAVSPLYMQLVIDNAISHDDLDILSFLFVAFLGLHIVASMLHFIRRLIILRAGQVLTISMMSNLFCHMLYLPSKFYELREMGDIVSRFTSTNAIQGFLTGTAIDALVDGFSASVILGVLFIYSAPLALISGAVLAAQGVMYFGSVRIRNLASGDALVASGREQTAFIETVRAVRSIKLFGKESDRFNHWLQRLLEMADTHYRYLWIESSVNAAVTFVENLGNIVIIFMAARWAINGTFTLGMMVSFIGYQAFFGRAAKSAVDALVSFQTLSVHLERISDLALAEAEQPDIGVSVELTGNLAFDNVSFRYPGDVRWRLNCVSFVVSAGEVIAVTGPSGEGKSTLLKVLLGLEFPTTGRVLYDNIELETCSRRGFLEQVACVLQDDVLLSGSIADNITFFAERYDLGDVKRCAEWADIHRDVAAMPMQYDTEVGEMGGALSGGQRQRLLLARALYKNPKILLLDEATSHLDLESEKKINETLRGLGITQIIVAHRPDSLRIASRVFSLQEGRLNLLSVGAQLQPVFEADH